VLSGTLDDGTAGLLAIKQRGGVAIVQNPDEAQYSGMPRSAIENVEVDQILRVSDITTMLVKLAYKPVEQEGADAVPKDMEIEADMAELELGAMQSRDRPGKPSPYGCPECNGVLWQLDEGKLIRFRCRTGHAFSPGSLLAKQSEVLEEALWNALRALEEKAALTQKLASRARDRNQSFSTKRFEEQAQVAQQQATLVRNLLLQGEDNVKGEGSGDGSTVNGQMVGAQLIAEQRKQEDKGIDLSVVSPSSLQVVAICASAGGLNALSQVLSALPADFPAAITVVQHLSRHQPSMMADILSRRIALQVKQAEAGDCLRPGTVYIAPPDNHLLINPDGSLSLSHSELVHFVRPSADLLFESVAASLKQRAIALVLTGRGSDGAMGVRAIKEMGGTVIAQDRDTSEYYDMPEAAINTGVVDWVVPLNQIATTLVNLVNMKAEELDWT
jgi:two-component system chemotaxis response regulator CheB